MRVSFSSHTGHSRRFPVAPSIILYVMSAIFLIVSGAMYWASGAVGEDAKRLAAEGQEIEAEVIGRRIVEKIEYDRDSNSNSNSSFNRERKTTTYYVTIAYNPTGNERIEKETTVSRSRYEALGDGAKVKIFYAPSDPQLIEFEKGEKAGEAKFFFWISLVVGTLAVGLLGLGLYLRRSSAGA